MEKPVKAIKVKINGLSAQLGRETDKENIIKSRQGSYEQYHSSWSFRSQLQFLIPVMTATKSKDNLTTKSCFGVEVEEDKENV